jgi:hypothetical protein
LQLLRWRKDLRTGDGKSKDEIQKSFTAFKMTTFALCDFLSLRGVQLSGERCILFQRCCLQEEPVIDRRRLLYAGFGLAASSFVGARWFYGFQPWRETVVDSKNIVVGGAALRVDFGEGDFRLAQSEVLAWVRRAAEAVAGYYGRFPVTAARVLVLPSTGGGIHNGTTWGDVGGSPAFTRIRVGERTTAEQLRRDWMMTHELVHTGLPSLPDENHWFEEGTAVYVEPIARVQAGQLSEEQVWGDMMRDMPQGQPDRGDEGLNGTRSWGRTYWGGAGFCLLADVEIRKRTKNRRGLQDALRGIVRAGGNIAQNWEMIPTLQAGDAATGTHVLVEFYERMRDKPVTVDLDDLWKQLGVGESNGSISFNAKAPLADIRQAIFAKTA